MRVGAIEEVLGAWVVQEEAVATQNLRAGRQGGRGESRSRYRHPSLATPRSTVAEVAGAARVHVSIPIRGVGDQQPTRPPGFSARRLAGRRNYRAFRYRVFRGPKHSHGYRQHHPRRTKTNKKKKTAGTHSLALSNHAHRLHEPHSSNTTRRHLAPLLRGLRTYQARAWTTRMIGQR